jgi:hypothetical protein
VKLSQRPRFLSGTLAPSPRTYCESLKFVFGRLFEFVLEVDKSVDEFFLLDT